MKIKCSKYKQGLVVGNTYDGVVVGKYVLVVNEYKKLQEYNLEYFSLDKELRSDKIKKILKKW